MATGWTCKNASNVDVDLDAVFEPRGSTTPTANTGLRVGSQDFADRYMASTSSADQIAFDTKFYRGAAIAANDFRKIFRRHGYVGITSFYGNSSVEEGDSVAITVVAEGSGLHYEWRFNGSTFGAPDSSTYYIASASESNEGTYSVRVYNDHESVLSGNHYLSVEVPADDPPTASISGASSVQAGVAYPYPWYCHGTADPDVGLKKTRFYITGHGAGTWSSTGGSEAETFVYWSGSLGSPDIFNAPGTYTFNYDVWDNNDVIVHSEMSVTVTP